MEGSNREDQTFDTVNLWRLKKKKKEDNKNNNNNNVNNNDNDNNNDNNNNNNNNNNKQLTGWKKKRCYLRFTLSYHVLLHEGIQFPFSPMLMVPCNGSLPLTPTHLKLRISNCAPHPANSCDDYS